VFENRMLSGIFEPKKGEVTGNWTKLHNEELRNLFTSPSIIRMVKSGRMRRMQIYNYIKTIGYKS
jgi:hypothetical protein